MDKNNTAVDIFLKGLQSYNTKSKDSKKIKSIFLYILKNLIYRSAHFCSFSNRKTININDLKSAITLEFYNKDYSNKIINVLNKYENKKVNLKLKDLLYSFIPEVFIIQKDIIVKIYYISIFITEDIVNSKKIKNNMFLNEEKFMYFFQNFNK